MNRESFFSSCIMDWIGLDWTGLAFFFIGHKLG